MLGLNAETANIWASLSVYYYNKDCISNNHCHKLLLAQWQPLILQSTDEALNSIAESWHGAQQYVAINRNAPKARQAAPIEFATRRTIQGRAELDHSKPAAFCLCDGTAAILFPKRLLPWPVILSPQTGSSACSVTCRMPAASKPSAERMAVACPSVPNLAFCSSSISLSLSLIPI